MVRRSHRRSDEIMLIPFLDILCSLIGVLVLRADQPRLHQRFFFTS